MDRNKIAEGMAGALSLIFAFACMMMWLFCATGCIGMIAGIKEWPTEHGPIKFVTGFDLAAGASGTDTLDNRKGINSKEFN